jgi:hypothetical protein
MSTNRRRVISLMLGSILMLVLCLFMVWPCSEIQRHRKYVEDSRITHAKPANLKELFSRQTLGWLRQRGTTRSRRAELGKEHEEALIRLGYFERRSYSYTNIDVRAFFKAVWSASLQDPLHYFEFGSEDRGEVKVLAYTNDFERIERLLREHQKKI